MEPNERNNQIASDGLVHETKKIEEKYQLVEALHELRLAAIRGNLEVVRSTLAKGITVNQPLKGGWNALMYACSLGHPALVEYLLQQGANPNFHKELFTPLMAVCASSLGDDDRLVQCVDYLLLYKAHVNTAERHHVTPLMFAAKEGHAKVVARLLASNCAIDAQDSQGWTALFWAVNKGRASVVEMLVQRGAKDLPDRRGHTAADLARNKGLDHITDILMKNSIHPLESQMALNHLNSSDLKPKYGFGKGTETMLQALLEDLSASVVNNNGGCGCNFTHLMNSMDLENNLELFKAHQVISKLASSLNGCLQNSTLSTNTVLQSGEQKESKSVELSWKNVPYSTLEAREVLSQTVRQLEGLYASMSFMRLHMQGNPPAALVQDKHARISEVTALSQKALLSTRQLYDEIYFFHQYAKQLEESDHIVPADSVTEHKTDKHYATLVSSCMVAAVVVVILFNSRVLTFTVFSK